VSDKNPIAIVSKVIETYNERIANLNFGEITTADEKVIEVTNLLTSICEELDNGTGAAFMYLEAFKAGVANYFKNPEEGQALLDYLKK
jgi:hypothetical protein